MEKKIQERLKQLRQERNMSQEKLAAELGVSRMTIAGYEFGKRSPDTEFVLKACDYFDCNPDYILGVSQFKNEDQYQKWTSSAQAFAQASAVLPDDQRQELVSALSWLLQKQKEVEEAADSQDYLIGQTLRLVLSFQELFQTFAETVRQADPQEGFSDDAILSFYKTLAEKKSEMDRVVDGVCSDMFHYFLDNRAQQPEKK